MFIIVIYGWLYVLYSTAQTQNQPYTQTLEPNTCILYNTCELLVDPSSEFGFVCGVIESLSNLHKIKHKEGSMKTPISKSVGKYLKTQKRNWKVFLQSRNPSPKPFGLTKVMTCQFGKQVMNLFIWLVSKNKKKILCHRKYCPSLYSRTLDTCIIQEASTTYILGTNHILIALKFILFGIKILTILKFILFGSKKLTTQTHYEELWRKSNLYL